MPMRMDRLTEKSQEALAAALELAAERGQQGVEPDHLLLALLAQEGGLARPLLRAAGADPVAIEAEVGSAVERFPRVSGGAEPYLSQDLRRILEGASTEAEKLKDEYVSTEHLLLAMAPLAPLAGAGITRDALLDAL